MSTFTHPTDIIPREDNITSEAVKKAEQDIVAAADACFESSVLFEVIPLDLRAELLRAVAARRLAMTGG